LRIAWRVWRGKGVAREEVEDSYADDPVAALLARAYRGLAALVIVMHAEFSEVKEERIEP
jgi:hypothetical protein